MRYDLGTEVTLSSVGNMNMNINMKRKRNMNTFQQANACSQPLALNENVCLASPDGLASPGASHLSVRGLKGMGLRENIIEEKKLSRNSIYEEIHFQMNKIRVGTRYSRAKVYISLKTFEDMTFSVTLSGSVTTAVYETISMANLKKEYNIVTLIETLKEKHKNGLMVGRLKYKPRNGYKTELHRNIIPHVLIAVYPEHEHFGSTLYILGTEYCFEINEVQGLQKNFYDVVGIYRNKPDVMDENLAFDN